MVSFVEPLSEHLCRTGSDTAVVLFRNPHLVAGKRERTYAKFIYWDFQDALDSENVCIKIWNENIREYMCRAADHAVIMDWDFYTRTQKDWQLKNISLFQYPGTNESSNYKYIQERIPYTPNYLADDRTIALAALILELSDVK